MSQLIHPLEGIKTLQTVGSRLETSGQRIVFLSKVAMGDGFRIDMGAGYKDCSCDYTSCSSDVTR